MSPTSSRELHLISINHNFASPAMRIAMDLSLINWFSLEAHARFSLGVIGWVKISTCNRIEILIDAPANIDIYQIIDKWINLSLSEVDSGNFECLSGNHEVIKYLLELSTGLRSAIYGDDQILTQLKQSFENSRATDSGLSTLIERAYQCVMRCHKEITGKTQFKNQGVSLAYYGLKCVKEFYKEESAYLNKTILIIGAGNMAEQVVKYLPKFQFRKIIITNRTIEKAQRLAMDQNISVIDDDGLDFINPDVVLSCSIHGRALVEERFQPELIINYSLNGPSSVSANTSVVDLDEMQRALDEKNELRNSFVEDVNEIIAAHCILYKAWAEQWQLRNMR